MVRVNPYLNFEGNTEEAFNFYKSVFGGEFNFMQRFKDTPHGDNLTPEQREMIMHISLPIGHDVLLMGTDAVEGMGQKLSVGNNFSLAISPESEEEAKKYFDGLSAGGQVIMPLEKAFWGAYFGMFTDKFGIQWMVNYEEKQVPETGTQQKKEDMQLQH